MKHNPLSLPLLPREYVLFYGCMVICPRPFYGPCRGNVKPILFFKTVNFFRRCHSPAGPDPFRIKRKKALLSVIKGTLSTYKREYIYKRIHRYAKKRPGKFSPGGLGYYTPHTRARHLLQEGFRSVWCEPLPFPGRGAGWLPSYRLPINKGRFYCRPVLSLL